MKFNIIGAGRLGKNLALSLVSGHAHQLVAICNQTLESAVIALTELGSGIAVKTLAELPAVDLTFITTPDDTINTLVAAWKKPSGIIVHCSGALSSDILAPFKNKGCSVASIHPLRAFRKKLHVDAFKDCYCVVEGDNEATTLLTDLFKGMGAHVIPISAVKKNTYHAAAVMASNYLVTLAGSAATLFMDAGLSDSQARDMTQNLMQSSLANIQHTTRLADALTGPLARGDIETINTHLHAIEEPHIEALYRAAALATLPLTDLDVDALHALRKRLNEY